MKYPTSDNVHKFLAAVRRRVLKRGSRYYVKRRQKVDHLVKVLADRHSIKGTGTYKYWALKATCIFIGKET